MNTPRLISVVVLLMLVTSCDTTTSRFKVISHNIDSSNSAIDQKDRQVMQEIKSQEAAARSLANNGKADEVKEKCDELNNYLAALKDRLVAASGGMDEEGMPNHMDDIETATRIMVSNKAADTLKNKINDLRSFLLKQVVHPDSTIRSIPLKAADDKGSHLEPENWVKSNFYHVPVIAAVSLLTKYQNDVRSSELIILNRTLEESKVQQKIK